MTQKVMLHLISILVTYGNAGALLIMLVTSCDTDARSNGIKLPKSHFALHFIYLELRTAMVPLTKLLSHDGRNGANGVTSSTGPVTSNDQMLW